MCLSAVDTFEALDESDTCAEKVDDASIILGCVEAGKIWNDLRDVCLSSVDSFEALDEADTCADKVDDASRILGCVEAGKIWPCARVPVLDP